MSKVKFKIIDGGKAIPIGNNLYKLEGRSHEEDGIIMELKDGNAKTIIEAERDEIFEPKTHEFRIFSDSIKIGNKTPAQLAEAGYNPDIIFKAQQSINGNYGGSYAKDGTEENIPDIVKQQKEWLKNWYAVRLPLLGKEHLQQHVDKGLNTKYMGENEITEEEKKELIAKRFLAAYYPGVKTIHVSAKYKKDKKNPNEKILISKTKEYKDYKEPVIKSRSDKGSVPLHEYSHAVSFDYGNNPVETFIPDFINNDKLKKGSSEYYSADEEKYARIQELRYINNLDPIKTNYTKRDLKKFKNNTSKRLIEELKLGGMDEKDIINALNTWASNTNNETDNIVYAKNGARIKYDRGGISWLIDKLFGGEDNKENNKSNKQEEPLNIEELKLRQAYAESGFNSNAKSAKDAMGLFQIRQILLDDYNLANKTNYTLEDLKDDKLNMAIRDWKMNKNLASSWAIKNAAPDSVVYAKALGGYNMGNTDFIKGLEDAKKAGVDIYNSMDWIDTKWFPKETVDYINFILRNQNNSLSRNQLAYETSKKKNSDKVEGIRKGFKNGGQINMKLKHKNKQDITDMVMNEILPSSTGERKKFFTGGFWANLGANTLNSLLQGIVSPILNYKMADEIEKSGKDLQPVQMSKTYLDSRDHTLNNLLGDVDRTVNKFTDISSKNTNNSKTHMNRVRGLLSDAITKKQAIIGNSLNRSDDIRRENARMAQEVDKINITNKNQFALINEQNRLARQAAAMNARMAGNTAITQSIGSLLKGVGTAFSDWDKFGLSLLNSENPKAWDLLNKHFGNSWKL